MRRIKGFGIPENSPRGGEYHVELGDLNSKPTGMVVYGAYIEAIIINKPLKNQAKSGPSDKIETSRRTIRKQRVQAHDQCTKVRDVC